MRQLRFSPTCTSQNWRYPKHGCRIEYVDYVNNGRHVEYSIPHYSSFLAIQVVRSASRGSLPDSTRFPTFLLANPQRLPPPPTGSADVIITQKCSVEHPSSPTSKFATYISQGPLEKRIPTGPTSPEGGAGKEGKKDGREEGAGGGGGAMVFPFCTVLSIWQVYPRACARASPTRAHLRLPAS